MAKKVSSIALLMAPNGVYEILYKDYRFIEPGYTERYKKKRFLNIDEANNFLKDLYAKIDGLVAVENWTYKPKDEGAVDRTGGIDILRLDTIQEYAKFMFFSKDASFNQPCPLGACLPENIVGYVLNYVACKRYGASKQAYRNNIFHMQKVV